MKEEKMWDEKVVIRLHFLWFVWYLVIFFVNLHRKKQGIGSCSTLSKNLILCRKTRRIIYC